MTQHILYLVYVSSKLNCKHKAALMARFWGKQKCISYADIAVITLMLRHYLWGLNVVV